MLRVLLLDDRVLLHVGVRKWERAKWARAQWGRAAARINAHAHTQKRSHAVACAGAHPQLTPANKHAQTLRHMEGRARQGGA